jgi:Domain of unknown function (DUF5916)/Carbohydrate family 9 binding domain-like
MTTKKSIFVFVFLLVSYIGSCQVAKKTVQTKFTSEKIVIDAQLNEEVWKTADIATDFIMVEPDNGTQESPDRKTEVKILYDNEAIYVAAVLYDNNPKSIQRELTTRDDFATADHFGITFNGFNDGQQDFRFLVSAAGVQQDCVYTESNGEDFSWDAIWDSHVEITDYGWVVEMKIPYAALRFSSEKKQTWGLNLYREVRNLRQKFTWNRIDNNINNEANQAGILEGIENIEPPTRLFLIPYSSVYVNANDAQKTKVEFKGGLDIKYGINDAFTLDAILVPDFGQAAFDNVELNLGPFEQQFNENRPFFTEGTELFSKGFLLYSRRIGGRPSTRAQLDAGEVFEENPTKIDLLNALKISGRTKNGLGVGVLNAVTEKTSAIIRNTTTGETRSEVIEPLANFNVFVLDQRFRKNSSVSFLNTNVTRNGEFRDANVSALLFDLNTKKNTYNLSGDYKYSYINEYGNQSNRTGYNTSLNFAETSGKYRWSMGGQYVSTDWDNNDLGINFQTHYHTVYANNSYRILNPTKLLNAFNVNNNHYAEFDNRTGRLQGYSSNLFFNFTSKKNDYIGFGANGSFFKTYDFYEPRTENEQKFLTIPKRINPSVFFSSNYNRKLALDINPFATFFEGDNRYNSGIFISPRYRFTNKFSMIYEFTYTFLNNNLGYVDQDDTVNEIYIGKRDRTTYINALTGKYSVNNVMNFNLSIRHYWSYALYDSVFTLQDDGGLVLNPTYTNSNEENFNTWNLDLSYSWWFAPGSQMSILYRNNALIDNYGVAVDKDYGSNIKNLINNQNLDHIFSISIRYFIDYNSLKR